MIMDELQQYVPLAGVAAAVGIWLRQYWFQQRLTNEIVETLRRDNRTLRLSEQRLQRENAFLRSNADKVVISLLDTFMADFDELHKEISPDGNPD